MTSKKLINSCANITGGGLKDNIKRILPSGTSAKIELDKIKPNNIFKWLHKQGINDKEMLKTFNCGVGFCLITNKKNVAKIKKIFSHKYQPYQIGFVSKNKLKIKTFGKLEW